MNSNIQNLFSIAQKTERRIIGLMSGTSLDGLDVALCSFKGQGRDTEVSLLNFSTIPYSEPVKNEIRKVFAKDTIEFQQLCVLNPWIGILHGKIVLQCLKSWNIESTSVDIIASHGQTVYHAPKSQHNNNLFSNSTLQIGDGDHVAVTTGIITISDFRQKHIAAGGEGAPLALYGDYLLFSNEGEERILLNIGGIANFTYLPGSGVNSQNTVFSTDTGPGNTLLDYFTREFFGKEFDEDSKISKLGAFNVQLLSALKRNEFFEKPFPKTTGPETFSYAYVTKCQEKSQTKNIRPEDLLATLTRLSAETIAEGIKKCLTIANTPLQIVKIYTSGGGNHNPLLMSFLAELLAGACIDKIDVLGVPGDAKEAILFANLANEALCGNNINFGNRHGLPSISMGKISFPR